MATRYGQSAMANQGLAWSYVGRYRDATRTDSGVSFISLFRACAESLASENASRLSAMERADKNIDELLENFHSAFRQLCQTGIDEELFDVISGYEALSKIKTHRSAK